MKDIKYYELSDGIIIKILLNGFACYRLNTVSKKWEVDFEIWNKIKNGKIYYTEIDFDDIYLVDNKKNNTSTSKYQFDHNYNKKTESEVNLYKKIEYNDKIIREYCKNKGLVYGTEISYSTRGKIGK